jgi:tetratricopeptide (TPR) repeat protein
MMELKTVNQIGNFTGLCKEIPFRKQIADLYFNFGQIEESLKEYLLLLKLEPQEADHYYQAGGLFEERNKSDKAVGYYRKAIEINERHHGAHYKLGVLLYKMKKPVESKAELERALRLSPEYYKAYFFLGRILKDNHDYTGALLAFEKAQRDPDQKVKSLIERGGCYMSMNSIDRAVTELQRAVALSPDEGATETLYARYFLSLCYEKMRDIDKAIENWEKIYSKKPSFRDVAEKLSQYQELRTDDRVKDYLTATIEEFYNICKISTEAMGLGVRDITDIPNGCQVIAVESESEKWRNARKQPKLLRFLRIPELISESTVRSLHEEMKNLGVTRGVVITSSNFSRKAIDFAETRPIDLVNKEQLQTILQKADFSDQTAKRRK